MKHYKILLPILFTILVIFSFYYTKCYALKFYPVLMNLFFFLVFVISLFQKETIIQKIAKKLDGALSEKIAFYTRNLTYIWCCVTFINFLLSLCTLFLSTKIWALYNGLISYIIIGTVFVVEYPIRLIYKMKVRS